jgi:hypothetical protein
MAGAQEFSRWLKSNPHELSVIGVALLVMALSGWTGFRSRGIAAELASKRSSWSGTAEQLATVQQQFRVPSSTENAVLMAESNRMGALGVPRADRLALVDMVGRLAEACALRSVRVNTSQASDSAFVPDRQVGGTPIKSADYLVAVEFVGSFANAQKFVSSLPPSVTLSRLTATRRDGGANYRLVLSVYELDANSGN